jgi:hypothetical protein
VLFENRPIGTVAYLGGVPAVLEEFCWSWGQLIQYNTEYVCQPGELIHYDRARASFHAFARNMLAARMMGDWLLMLDTDHQFEPDVLARLLHRMQRYGLEVVTGIYQFRGPPHSPVLYVWDAESQLYQPLGDWDRSVPLFPVAASGAGCLLVRRSVLDRIRTELGEGPFDIRPPLSEDLSFFQRLHELGVQGYCDSRIECHHLRASPLSLADYQVDPRSLAPRQDAQGYN